MKKTIDGKPYKDCAHCGTWYYCYWYATGMIGRPRFAGLCEPCRETEKSKEDKS